MQPNIQSPYSSSNDQPKIQFDRNYLLSITGVFHIAIIVILFPAIISVAAVPKTAYLSQTRTATENAYLFFGCFAYLLEIILFILFILSICSLDIFKRVPTKLIVCIKDLLFAVPLFSLSISCAVFETQQRSGSFVSSISYNDVYDVYNYGAFASAAVFGFLATLFYMSHFISVLFDLLKERKSSYQ